jgi:hypothetical protein
MEVGASQSVSASSDLNQLSCPSTSVCVGLSQGFTDWYTDDGGSVWTMGPTTSGTYGSEYVSCPTVSYCEESWGTGPSFGNVSLETAVSIPSGGNPLGATGTWTSDTNEYAPVANINVLGGTPDGVSCVAADHCEVVSAPFVLTGGATSYEGEFGGGSTTSWTPQLATPPGNVESQELQGVTCAPYGASHVACYMWNDGGIIQDVDDSSTWTAVLITPVAPAEVYGDGGDNAYSSGEEASCPSALVCYYLGNAYAADYAPDAQIYSTQDGGQTWKAASFAIGGFGSIQAIDCVSTTECLAVTYGGDLLFASVSEPSDLTNSSNWTDYPATVPAAINDVSCGSSSSCVAVGGDGGNADDGFVLDITISDGGVTSALDSSSTFSSVVSLASVACPATDACIVSGDAGHIYQQSSGDD